MARSIFTTTADEFDRRTSIQLGGAISAEFLKRCATQASELTEVIAAIAYDLGCTDETTGAKSTAIEAMAARVQQICDLFSEYFDEDDRDCSTIDDLVRLLSPDWQLRNEQFEKICREHMKEASEAVVMQRTPVGVLSAQAVADIDAHIVRTGVLIDLFLQGSGDFDADLVNIIDFAKGGFERAKMVAEFDQAYHRIIEAESVLKAALALAKNSDGTSPGAVALLGDLIAASDGLSSKFDGGVHDVAQEQAARPSPAVKRKAVAA